MSVKVSLLIQLVYQWGEESSIDRLVTLHLPQCRWNNRINSGIYHYKFMWNWVSYLCPKCDSTADSLKRTQNNTLSAASTMSKFQENQISILSCLSASIPAVTDPALKLSSNFLNAVSSRTETIQIPTHDVTHWFNINYFHTLSSHFSVIISLWPIISVRLSLI